MGGTEAHQQRKKHFKIFFQFLL